MTDLSTVGPPLGLQATSAEMSPEQRCSIGIRNIELLCDLDWRGRLLLGAELSRMKWSGDFTRDDVWRSDEKARGWDEWLKRRDFRLGGEKTMAKESANTLIMWSVLYANFAAVNEQRAERGLLPLPLPTSVSQLRPYASMMRRVDDWQPPELDRSHPNDHAGAFDLQAPFAESQPEVLAAWQEAYESIPPDKRQRKGNPRPPTETESSDYLRKKEGLKQLKAREERDIAEAKKDALTVGEKLADPAKQAAAAAPSRAKAKAKPAPKKSAEELEAERRQYQIQQDVQGYRLKMNNLQQSAESLEAFIKNTLAREGSDSYLQILRQQDMGIYSVSDDVAKLRDAVVVCQSIYKLITEPYIPPIPVSRHEVDPTTATIDL